MKILKYVVLYVNFRFPDMSSHSPPSPLVHLPAPVQLTHRQPAKLRNNMNGLLHHPLYKPPSCHYGTHIQVGTDQDNMAITYTNTHVPKYCCP